MIYIKCISKHQQNNITTFKNKSAITHCSAAKRWIHLLRLNQTTLTDAMYIFLFSFFYWFILFICEIKCIVLDVFYGYVQRRHRLAFNFINIFYQRYKNSICILYISLIFLAVEGVSELGGDNSSLIFIIKTWR